MTGETEARLILIRGLPGSGKSTMARAMEDRRHFEADMFFEDANGVYNYDREKIKDAHEWCQRETFNALANGNPVVVSNTFTRVSEMKPYFDMAKRFNVEVRVMVAEGTWPNVHGVPDVVVDKMRQRWEGIQN